MDITKPIPERRAARQAAERLTQLTKSIGVQATTSSPSVVKVKDDVIAGGSFHTSQGESVVEEFGFTQEEMISFKAKIEQEKSMKCPLEVCITNCPTSML